MSNQYSYEIFMTTLNSSYVCRMKTFDTTRIVVNRWTNYKKADADACLVFKVSVPLSFCSLVLGQYMCNYNGLFYNHEVLTISKILVNMYTQLFTPSPSLSIPIQEYYYFIHLATSTSFNVRCENVMLVKNKHQANSFFSLTCGHLQQNKR